MAPSEITLVVGLSIIITPKNPTKIAVALSGLCKERNLFMNQIIYGEPGRLKIETFQRLLLSCAQFRQNRLQN